MPPFPLAEEWIFVRSVNFKMTDSAVGVARVIDVVERRGSRSNADSIRIGNTGRIGMAFKTQEPDNVTRQQFRVGRTVRRMADLTAFDLDWRMFVNEGPLFIRVTFDASRIAVDRIAQRFAHKPAMLVMAIGAFHAAFRHLVMKGFGERSFLIGVTLVAHVWLGVLEQKLRPFR